MEQKDSANECPKSSSMSARRSRRGKKDHCWKYAKAAVETGDKLEEYTLTSQAKSIPVRKDDEVLIVRGKYKGREGKVTQVCLPSTCLVTTVN